MGFAFFAQNLGLGVGLAMDAFSVSLANGMNEPSMKKRRACGVAGTFALFQFLMPLIGWVCVWTVARQFSAFEKCIPWLALALLAFIGGKMLYEGITAKPCEEEKAAKVGFGGLILQGIATSIDALSVGFTIATYGFLEALLACFLIGGVTFILCFAGVLVGKKAGTCLAGKAGVLGGVILLAIGLKIFLEGIL